MQHNKVTVFNNGMADFLRAYPVKKGEETKISISAKTNHIGDILASLNIFGDVTLTEPPNFEPIGDNQSDFTFDAENSIEDLIVKLSGSKVSITLKGTMPIIEGTLIGKQSSQTKMMNEIVINENITVLTSDGIRSFPLDSINNLKFVDEAIKSEIEKVLGRNFQKIKPQSTFINLTVKGNKEDSLAIVQYAVPNAAWKISYRLNELYGVSKLKGLAIVDNNTEEDWKNVIISVVTGEPITFSTDLAMSKVPKRNHVNVVNENSPQVVEVESYMKCGPMNHMSRLASDGGGGGSEVYACNSNSIIAESLSLDVVKAETEIKEIGDYSIFTASSPVTINANRSAVIPVFDTILKDSKTVLYYKQNSKTNRPYRAIEIRNETEYSLARGVVTLYKDGTLEGSAIFPATKPNEKQLIAYALDTGVKILEKESPLKSVQTKIVLKGGFFKTENSETISTTFTLINSKNEEFEVCLDVNDKWTNSVYSSSSEKEPESIPNGKRYKITLPAKATCELNVVQSRITKNSIDLNMYSCYQLSASIESLDLTIDGFGDVLKLIEEYEELGQRIDAIKKQITQNETKQTRLRENIKTIGLTSGQDADKYRADLMTCENYITTNSESTVPGLEKEKDDLDNQINEKLKKLVFNYSRS